MQIHDLVQGSQEWLAYRAGHYNASDAPAMLGVSPYKTRTELLHERYVGAGKEVDSATQSRFDNGHRFEALARGLAEDIVGEDLYPITGSVGELSASFDGLTMGHDVVWEHKSLNDDIRGSESASDLGLHLRVQMEQQLLVSGADKALFLASSWDDEGNLLEEKHFWYEPDASLRARIIAGWEQFAIDLAAYQPKEIADKPVAGAIMELPALSIQIRGEVVASNLPAFKTAATAYIAAIKTDLVTDDDFANAEATVKFCKAAEENLDLTKAAALGQTATIDELMKTIDFIQAELRTKRLVLEKLVKSEKEAIKDRVLLAARTAYDAHIAGLEEEIKPLRLASLARPDFAGAAKNKRTIKSLNDSVDTELANGKIAADAVAKDYRAKLQWCKENAEGYGFLFSDLAQLVGKPMEDFQMVVNKRIDDHKTAEQKKIDDAAKKLVEEQNAAAEQVKAPHVEPAAPAPTPAKFSAPVRSTAPAATKPTAPTPDQIIEVLSLHFRVHESKVIEWLLDMDLEAAGERMAANI